jgi:hypothetical protein
MGVKNKAKDEAMEPMQLIVRMKRVASISAGKRENKSVFETG